MKKLTIIILSAVLFNACSKDSDQSATSREEILSQSAQASPVTREFRGQFQSSIDPDPSIPPTPCSGDLPGFANPGHFLHGNATHLGEVIWQQSRLQDVSCNLSFATMQLTTTISGQFAASNGDLVYYTGNDVFDVTNLLTQAGTTGTLQGVWTITGGTGRFAGATGSFTINGEVDFITRTFSFQATGTITY
jgi:hypothetical protein